MRLLLLLLFGSLCGLTGSLRAADTPPDVTPLKHWLAKQAEVKTIQADFTQTRRFRALRDPLASPGRFWYSSMPSPSFRWELGDPAKTVVLRKGDAALLIQPAKKRAERLPTADLGKPGAANPLPMLDFPMAKTYADFSKEFEVLSLVVSADGRCHVELQPRDPQAAKFLAALDLDFDTETNHLLAFEARTRDGSSLRNEFSNVRINAKIDPHTFDYDLTGYEVTDAKP